MPLNKAPSGALLFGGDMRLLLFSLFLFSSLSYSADDTFKSLHTLNFSIDGTSNREKCIAAYESNVTTNIHAQGVKSYHINNLKSPVYPTSQGYPYFSSMTELDTVSYGSYGSCVIKGFSVWTKVAPPKPPCETPKTDDQCNKGKTATITGNDVFWATGNYKGCTFTAADGVFIKLADGSMTGDATSTGSTGKSWCETTDSSYNPADDEALSKNPAFSPAKDNDPKNCKNGWVQAGGGKFHCLNDTSGDVDAPPDKVNPEDGSINSDKDGKPKPPDAGVGKPPTGDGSGGDGGGGSGGDGGGGDCEGEDCEGGGGTKPPARPSDPWADILDAADVARVKADTQSVQDELADFYRTAASGFQININKPAAGSMPSFGDVSVGGDKVSLSLDWLDKISFIDARAGVLVLCSLWAAYIILVRR